MNLELREECSRTLCWNPTGAASGCMQSGAAVEADAIEEEQPKWTRSGAAAEVDAIEEQQLEADECSLALLLSHIQDCLKYVQCCGASLIPWGLGWGLGGRRGYSAQRDRHKFPVNSDCQLL